MKTEQNKTKQLVLTGMMTAVVCVLSILEIPMPTGVPITLQTFALALCGYLLGWKKGFLAALLYLLLGAAGVPVFSGMSGGIQVMLGLTGGFIWGFPVLAALSGLGSGKKNAVSAVAFGVLGLAAVHLLGSFQFSLPLWKYVYDVPYAGVRSLSGERSSVGSGSLSGEPGA